MTYLFLVIYSLFLGLYLNTQRSRIVNVLKIAFRQLMLMMWLQAANS